MTDLQAQAKQYAKDILNNSDSETFSRQGVYYAVAEAYEQGYIDGDTKDDKPETEAEFFGEHPSVFPIVGDMEPYVYEPNKKPDYWSVHVDLARCTPQQLQILANLHKIQGCINIKEAPDCRYFSEGDCSKGLPGKFCERDGYVAYCPKEYAENAQITSKNE